MRVALFDVAGDFVETIDTMSATHVPHVLFHLDKIYVPAGALGKPEMQELGPGERALAMSGKEEGR